jgi:hypothetical protein
MTEEATNLSVIAEFDDEKGIAYTLAKLREELDDLYRRQPDNDGPKVRPGVLNAVGASIIGRLQQIDHLQRYQIAFLERKLARALNPPRHRYWGAGEPDCPREIKAGNGELHTLRCKVCGMDNPRDDRCLDAPNPSPPSSPSGISREDEG